MFLSLGDLIAKVIPHVNPDCHWMGALFFQSGSATTITTHCHH
jgi:hypothetical protein